MENLSLSVPDLLQTVKNFVSQDKHQQLDEMLKRYTSKQLGKQQLQFELRVVAGRDALRQALLAMVPQIDELQKKREAMKQQQGAVNSGSSSSPSGAAGSGSVGGGQGQWVQGVVKDVGGVETMPPLQGGERAGLMCTISSPPFRATISVLVLLLWFLPPPTRHPHPHPHPWLCFRMLMWLRGGRGFS